jgi:hypothetical protein
MDIEFVGGLPVELGQEFLELRCPVPAVERSDHFAGSPRRRRRTTWWCPPVGNRGWPTVKTHITRILTKLRLRDRAQVIVLAGRHGLNNP